MSSPGNAKRLFASLEWSQQRLSEPPPQVTTAKLRAELEAEHLSKKKPQKAEAEVIRVFPERSPQFREDFWWWANTEPRLRQRLWDLIESIVQDPFIGIGKPEPLKHLGSNLGSRRINLEHRLVYRIERNHILFLQARYHYK